MEETISKIRNILCKENVEVILLGFVGGEVIEVARGGKRQVWFNLMDVVGISAGRKIILTHNHPVNGRSNPSIADRTATRKLQAILGSNLVDHVIVTKTHTLSMREEGYLR